MPLNLVLLVVLIWAIVRPAKEALIVAFISGLFLDLAKGSPLAFSSFQLLVMTYLLLLYSRRFDPTHPVFLVIFVFLAATAANLVLGKPWLGESAILAILSFFLRPVLKHYSEGFDRGEIRLKI